MPVARRGNALSSSLGLGEKLFASSDERQLAKALDSGLELVEAGLIKQMSFTDDLADVTSRYLLDAGGKRIRPVLALLTAQLGTGNNANVITAAEAIEMTHLASLYHDDVMDEAQVRRGVPSAQTVWGNSVAILTGDLLFARASKLVAGMGERAILLQAETFERESGWREAVALRRLDDHGKSDEAAQRRFPDFIPLMRRLVVITGA